MELTPAQIETMKDVTTGFRLNSKVTLQGPITDEGEVSLDVVHLRHTIEPNGACETCRRSDGKVLDRRPALC